MRDGAERRAVALQEAHKTYGMQYAMTVALGESFPVRKEDVEDEVLRIADRYDDFLLNGETGLPEKEEVKKDVGYLPPSQFDA